jgi:hypothetical protein
VTSALSAHTNNSLTSRRTDVWLLRSVQYVLRGYWWRSGECLCARVSVSVFWDQSKVKGTLESCSHPSLKERTPPGVAQTMTAILFQQGSLAAPTETTISVFRLHYCTPSFLSWCLCRHNLTKPYNNNCCLQINNYSQFVINE